MTEDNKGTFSFEDRFGKKWDLKITLNEALRIDESDYTELTDHPISLTSPTKEGQEEMFTNARVMYALMYTVAITQMKREDEEYSQEEFMSRIDGGCASDAQWALLRSLADFFRKSQIDLLISQAEELTNRLKKNEKEDRELIKREAGKIADHIYESYEKDRRKLLEKRGTASTQ